MGRQKPPHDTLAALAESGLSLFIECGACGHSKRLNCYKVAMHTGWQAKRQEVEARHKCERCGKKRASIVRE